MPRLQREFVWNGPKAARLLDSIYRNLPIGSLVVWRCHRADRDLFRNSLHILPAFDPANKEVWFLLDGQQRLSVLYQASRGEVRENASGQVVDFGRLVFAVSATQATDEESRFRYRLPVAKEMVPLSKILAPNWRSSLALLGKKRLDLVARCRDRLLDYKVPVVIVDSGELDEVRELFVRINSLGTPIGAADRAFARAATVDLRPMAHDVVQSLPEGFRGLPNEMLLQTLALARGVKDVGERAYEPLLKKLEANSQASEVDKRAFLKDWGQLRKAIGKAVDYLRTNFHVTDETFLPSSYMISLLTLFYFYHPAAPGSRQRREIRKWFWATGVAQRYSGRGFRANIIGDADFFRRLAKRGQATFSLKELVERSELKRTDYARRSSISDAYFCLLASREPAYIENGEPLPLDIYASRANKRNKHHIFPKALLRRWGVASGQINSICNICFLVAEENQGIGSKPPAKYLAAHRRKRHFGKAMRSHLIPFSAGGGIWETRIQRGFRAFVKARLDTVVLELERAAGMKLFQRT